jgi:YebC/PmpR family DNA-binding regulatory protein
MAGHSKWKQIKRQKAVVDSKRAVVFTKLGREITMAAKAAGPDPAGNARLRLAIQKARESNMPADIIERAISKATGDADSAQLEEVVYEGYGPGGTAVLVEAVTDNRNRTVAEVRNVFNHAGGNLAEAGAVAWNFTTRGVITIPVGDSVDPDEAALVAIDAGAEDFVVEGDTFSVHTRPEDMEPVRSALEENGFVPVSSELARLPNAMTALDAREAVQALRLLDRLEDLDDVQRVYSNADFPDEVLAEFEG